MAYKENSMSYKDGMSGMEYGKMQGDMKAHVKDIQKPGACYAQKYDQSPLNYIERQDKRQVGEANQLRSEEFHGKYSS